MPIAPDHIVVVVEENHEYSQIIGNAQAPYINSLADGGALFTNYQGITNPSQPNYLALFSGSTHGVTDNRDYLIDAPTLAGQLEAAGLSFQGYEDILSPQKHNPWESFVETQDLGVGFSQFPDNFSLLPTVSFVSPNNQHNMHDGSVREGDNWLKANLGDYAEWAKANNSLLIVTFDEGSKDGENHIPTIVYGSGVVAGEYAQPFDHYDLLRTIQDLYGLAPLGKAAQGDFMWFGRGAPGPGPGPGPEPEPSRLVGTQRSDNLQGGDGDDLIAGLSGDDRLSGSGGGDMLRGGRDDDRIWSGAGTDVVVGGHGRDLLVGGTDDRGDDFIYNLVGHSRSGGGRDAIRNFTTGADDIDLRGIDARPGTQADNAFAWGGRTAEAHGVWWKATNVGVLLCADTTGDARADFAVMLENAVRIAQADVLL